MTSRLRIACALLLTVAVTSPVTVTDAATPNSCPANATWARGTWPAVTSGELSSSPKNNWLVMRDAAHSLLASDGDTVSRSTDGGCSWTPVFNAATSVSGADTVSFSAQAYVITTLAMPPYPGDGSRAYAILAPSGFAALTFNVVNPPVLVAESTDAGRTWTLHNDLISLASRPQCDGGYDFAAAVAPSAADVLYLVCYSSDVQGGEALFRSGDGGISWTSNVMPYQIAFGQVLAVDPGNTNAVLFSERSTPLGGGPENVIVGRSTDAGVHWSTKVVQPRVGDGAPVGIDLVRRGHATSALLYSTVGGVSESTDGGVTWRLVDRPLRGGPFVIAASYVGATGDIAVWEQYNGYGSDGTVRAYCNSSVTLTIYRGSRRVPQHVPIPATPWGRLVGFTNSEWFWYFGAYGAAMEDTGPGSVSYFGGWSFENGKCPKKPTVVPIARFTRH